jgi:hypothetical protein
MPFSASASASDGGVSAVFVSWRWSIEWSRLRWKLQVVVALSPVVIRLDGSPVLAASDSLTSSYKPLLLLTLSPVAVEVVDETTIVTDEEMHADS